MGKGLIFVFFVILAGAFVAAEDAPVTAAVSDPQFYDDEEVELVDGTDPELFEDEVGAADDTTDPEELSPTDVETEEEDIGSGLPIAQAPESDGGSNETDPTAIPEAPVPMGAPVPMAAPVPQNATGGGRTKVFFEKIIYKWTIINYRHHALEYGDVLYSPVFSGENTEEYQWQLQFYPRGDDTKFRLWASLYLASVGKDGARPNVKFSILDYRGRNVNIKKFNNLKYNGRSWGFGNFVRFALIEKGYHKIWVPGDRLTLVVEVSFSPGGKNANHCTDLGETDCLAMPYGNNDNPNVALFPADQTPYIRGHKAALSAHSTWLDDYFRKHPRANAVKIPADITSNNLKEAVRFIHTGEVDPSKAEKLKTVADILGMKKLKAMCEEVLCKSRYRSTTPEENP